MVRVPNSSKSNSNVGAVDIFSFWLVTAEADLPTCFITPARATAPEKFVHGM